LALGLRGHRELLLENLALRQQLMAMKRATSRRRLHARDRLFLIRLTRIWKNWRTSVVLVRPDTGVGWHRDWLRRRWTRRSSGRPTVTPEIRTLVREMATAKPLWGAPRIHGELREHRLRDFNNLPTTRLADIKRVLRFAPTRVKSPLKNK
jgi:putative transposase